MSDEAERIERFSWQETRGRLEALALHHDLVPDAARRAFVERRAGGEETHRPAIRFAPPLVQPIPEGAHDPHAYLAALADDPGTVLVLLVQAGAAALGVWRHAEIVRHKVIKKYMVRGTGKFQGTHLKTKGKSRYGSRLRLRNTVAFFLEINERLREWEEEEGPFDGIFYSCPVRLWAEVFHAKTPPPFERDDPLVKIPLTVRVPSFAELRRVAWEITHGALSVPRASKGAPPPTPAPSPPPPAPSA